MCRDRASSVAPPLPPRHAEGARIDASTESIGDDGQPPLEQVIDLLLDAICVVDRAGRFVYVSAAFERIFGYRPDEVIGSPMIDLVFHADRQRTLKRVDEVVAGGSEETHFENRYLCKDGRVVDIMWSARWSPTHRVRVAVARDVTARKKAEAVQAALYALSEAAYAATDLETLLSRVHAIIDPLLPAQEFHVVLQGDAEDESVTTDRHALAADVMRTGRPQSRSARVDRHDMVGAEAIEYFGVPLHREDRVVGALLVHCEPRDARYGDGDIELLGFVAKQVASAIERQDAATVLLHSARHDPLTDLPNRNLVRDRVTTALAHARRDTRALSVLYLDLDGFKDVNDRFGHAIGDALLREVARRLTRGVRRSDTVGRMGGDEFVVLLDRLQAPDDALVIAEELRAALGAPFDLDGRTLGIVASIGVAHYPAHGDDYERLLHRADEAMYLAKQEGGDRVRVADPAG